MWEGDKGQVADAVIKAGNAVCQRFHLENTEVVTTGTPANHKTIFRIPERGISFQFGAETYRFNKDFSSWAAA